MQPEVIMIQGDNPTTADLVIHCLTCVLDFNSTAEAVQHIRMHQKRGDIVPPETVAFFEAQGQFDFMR